MCQSSAYSGMITTEPCVCPLPPYFIESVETETKSTLMPITSSASMLFSLIRMASLCGGAVAARRGQRDTGDNGRSDARVLASAAKNPVNASTPLLPSDARSPGWRSASRQDLASQNR